METYERHAAILRLLCKRRHETIKNLAFEFDVSERTIRRDIEALSYREPIYTQPGKYGGGVYVTDNYHMDRMYFRETERNVLYKLLDCVENKKRCDLTEEETVIFKRIIENYTKPVSQNNNERRAI